MSVGSVVIVDGKIVGTLIPAFCVSVTCPHVYVVQCSAASAQHLPHAIRNPCNLLVRQAHAIVCELRKLGLGEHVQGCRLSLATVYFRGLWRCVLDHRFCVHIACLSAHRLGLPALGPGIMQALRASASRRTLSGRLSFCVQHASVIAVRRGVYGALSSCCVRASSGVLSCCVGAVTSPAGPRKRRGCPRPRAHPPLTLSKFRFFFFFSLPLFPLLLLAPPAFPKYQGGEYVTASEVRLALQTVWHNKNYMRAVCQR